MKSLIQLIKFMTRIPVPIKTEYDSKSLGDGMKWFPVVGLLLGAINLGIGYLAGMVIPSQELIGIILIITGVVSTGGLHLDGLADTFDGIFSYRSKQKMLEIMKDSRVGTNGVLSLILYFILIITLLVETSYKLGVSQGVLMLIVPVIARLNSVVNCATSPYARPTGMGKTFVDNTSVADLGISYIVTSGIIFGYSYLFGLSFIKLFIIKNIVIALGFLYGKLITRKIGGITGDTLGSLVEISSILTLLFMYIIM